MREHPIPQDVTGYKFHIIGNMTLKQFAELGLAVFICIILYNTNLFFFIKWPMIALIAVLGFMVAFVPVAERPLDHWIITFIRILYKPTKYYWRREPKIPDPFLYKPPQYQNQNEIEIDLTPAKQQRVRDFFNSINTPKTDPTDIQEKNRIDAILNSFSTVKTIETDVVSQKVKPNLGVRVRNLKPTPSVQTITPPQQPELVVFQNQEAIVETKYEPIKKQAMPTTDVAGQIEIPELQTISLNHKHEQELEMGDSTTSSVDTTNSFLNQDQISPSQQTQVNTNAQNVKQNISLPFPTKPTEPNKIVGMVLTPDNKIIPNAIVEIKDGQGKILRAVKTNLLGQFFITTALANGTYYVSVDSDGFDFQELQIKLSGRIVDPLEIRCV